MMKKWNLKYLSNITIGIIIMFGFGFLPAIAPMTPLGMQLLGIFIALCWLWTTADIIWPSVLGLAALALSDYGNMSQIIAISFGNDIVATMIFITAVLAVFDSAGLNDHIASWFLHRKMMTKGPWRFTIIWFLAVWVLAALSNALMAIMLFWALFYKLADELDIPKTGKYGIAMITGTAMFASLVTIVWPFKALGLILIGAFKNMSGLVIDPLYYMITMVTLSVTVILLYVFIMKWVLHVDVTPLKNISTSTLALQPQLVMSKRQKFLLVVLFVFIIFLLLPSVIPRTWLLGQKLNQIGPCGTAMLLFAFLAIWKIDDEPLLKFKEIKNKITWDIVFLVASAMAVSTALTSEGTGVKEFMVSILAPIFEGKSGLIFMIAICGVCLILTNIANNAVIGLLLANVIAIYASGHIINASGTMVLMVFCSAVAFVFPSSSVMAAILYGNEYLTPKMTLKYTLLMVLLSFAVVCVIGIPLVNFLF